MLLFPCLPGDHPALLLLHEVVSGPGHQEHCVSGQPSRPVRTTGTSIKDQEERDIWIPTWNILCYTINIIRIFCLVI